MNPLAPAAAPAALHTAIARSRCAADVVIVVSNRNAEGTDAAAAAPCKQRPTVSTTTDGAVAATAAATVVDVDDVTVWDPATERRRATVSLPTRAELAPKIARSSTISTGSSIRTGGSFDELDPEFRIPIYGAVVFRVAAYAFGSAGTDVYRHNLDAMASTPDMPLSLPTRSGRAFGGGRDRRRRR